MRDPFFERTVVLVWHHDEDGAIGVVINRLMEESLQHVLHATDGIDVSDCETDHVFWGGPVEPGSGTVVTPEIVSEEEGWNVDGGIGITRSLDVLVRLLTAKQPFQLCLGYAGWGPGQLHDEIQAGGWLWTDCDASVVFDVPPDERYDHALATLGLTASMVWMQPIHE
jgi:putative transcriptional regulator